MDDIFEALNKIPNFENCLYAGLLIFPRFAGFFIAAPIFNRKDVSYFIKLGLMLIMTISFVPFFKNTTPPADTSFFLSILLNFVFGALIGYMAAVIFETIVAAGEMVNMQMGLQSSVMFDPNAGGQTSVMGRFFMYFGTVIFIHIGGLYWLILAFMRGFEVFPIYGTAIPLKEIVDLNYIIYLTGNVLFIGLQLSAPIVITTLCQDIILGIISKIAPQINVFQLSFLFKPVVGTIIMLIILPLLANTIIDYFNYYSKIF